MNLPLHSEAPALFWFYRLVGFGAIAGAVAFSRKRSGGSLGDPPESHHEFASWFRETYPKGTRVVLTEDVEGLPRGSVVKVADWSDGGIYFEVMLKGRNATVWSYVDHSWIPFEIPRLRLLKSRP